MYFVFLGFILWIMFLVLLFKCLVLEFNVLFLNLSSFGSVVRDNLLFLKVFLGFFSEFNLLVLVCFVMIGLDFMFVDLIFDLFFVFKLMMDFFGWIFMMRFLFICNMGFLSDFIWFLFFVFVLKGNLWDLFVFIKVIKI